MPEIYLKGVPVQFPFTPYESQKEFMSSVIQALQNNENALLESPTGTGKTLCLLCSVLGWLETHLACQQRSIRQAVDDTDEMARLEEQLKAGSGSDMPSGFGQTRVRVIYASRTHTQLSQVMGELKRTRYSGFRTAIIASREQLCIHPTVSKLGSNHEKQTNCRVKVQTRTCHFYNNVEKKKDLLDFKNPENPESNILDIEDLKKLGNKHKCCPYYVTRAAAKETADIIFMPYNYLLDPMIRKRHGVDLDGAIVIFDEAHNLNQVAEDSSSVEITSYDLVSAIEEVDNVMHFLENVDKEVMEDGFNQNNADGDSINFELLTLENLARVKKIVIDLDEQLNGLELSREKELKKPGDYLYELLSKVNLDFDTYLPVYEVMDASVAYLSKGGLQGVHRGQGLGRIVNFLKVVFESDTYNKDKSPQQRKAYIAQYYKVYVCVREEKKKPKKSYWEPSEEEKPVRVLSFWCFSPGFSMTDLQKQGVRCILLTSGTLKPLDSLSSELRIDFPVRLENPHVISPSQISVSVVKQGPESVVLNSNYQNRSDPRYHTSLGYAIMQIAKAVPNGMLVFFPSYYIMKIIIETWNNGHIMQCITRYKQMFIEPTNKEEFTQAMEQYYATINDATANGAIFCGVCRGKVSEGLDFVDKNGRAVVITGIPYAPAKDPKVVMKKTYLDEQLRKSKQKVTLTGTQWYSQQASRAVNQAIGRVIRHRFDYGAILLLDTRFANPNTRDELPEWVKSEIKVHETFSSVIRMLNQFFSTVPALVESRKAQSGLITEPEKPTARPQISISYSSDATSSTSSKLSARSVYGEKTLSTKHENSSPTESETTVNLQPAKKKIKMQMVPGLVEEKKAEPAKPEVNAKNQPKLNLALEALQECRRLLSHNKADWSGVKRSLLVYQKTKKMEAMADCIRILLQQQSTHHILDTFRTLTTSAQRDAFDSLVKGMKSKLASESGPPTESRPPMERGPNTESIQSAQSSNGTQECDGKTRYSMYLSMIQACKKQLSKEEGQIVKTSLIHYKNGGSVEILFQSLLSIGLDTRIKLLTKFRAALREADLKKFDEMLSAASSQDVMSSAAESEQTSSGACGDVQTPVSIRTESVLSDSHKQATLQSPRVSQTSLSLFSDSPGTQASICTQASSCTAYNMSTEVESSLPEEKSPEPSCKKPDAIPTSDNEDVIPATPPE